MVGVSASFATKMRKTLRKPAFKAPFSFTAAPGRKPAALSESVLCIYEHRFLTEDTQAILYNHDNNAPVTLPNNVFAIERTCCAGNVSANVGRYNFSEKKLTRTLPRVSKRGSEDLAPAFPLHRSDSRRWNTWSRTIHLLLNKQQLKEKTVFAGPSLGGTRCQRVGQGRSRRCLGLKQY